jgi:hypothetical protein
MVGTPRATGFGTNLPVIEQPSRWPLSARDHATGSGLGHPGLRRIEYLTFNSVETRW